MKYDKMDGGCMFVFTSSITFRSYLYILQVNLTPCYYDFARIINGNMYQEPSIADRKVIPIEIKYRKETL